MIPILICIPYWSGDRSEALDLCKIIAGLQATHAKQLANILLIARQDCQIDSNMMNILVPKFNIHTLHSTSPLKGWPSGANGMFGSAMIHISNNFSKNFECVYWMEPDCVPIRPNWFWDLVLEWRKKHATSLVVGCRSDCNGDGTGDHITGCALYHPNIARLMPEITTSDKIAWDYQHRAKIIARGGSTKIIENWYKATNASNALVDKPGVSIIHGHKDSSLRNLVKRKYNIS